MQDGTLFVQLMTPFRELILTLVMVGDGILESTVKLLAALELEIRVGGRGSSPGHHYFRGTKIIIFTQYLVLYRFCFGEKSVYIISLVIKVLIQLGIRK